MNALVGYLGREHIPVSALESLYGQYGTAPGFVDDVISSLNQLDPLVAYRAVWLLRRFSTESALSERSMGAIADLVDSSEHWIFRLTMCQFLSGVKCPHELQGQVFPFLEKCFADRRTIVRAWALTAMAGFQSDPGYRRKFKAALRLAGRDPSKAMQARLRQLKRA